MLVTRTHACSVTERDSRRARGEHHIVIELNALRKQQNFRDGHTHDVRRLQRDHLSPTFLRDRAHGRAAETRGEQTIVSRWHAASLQVAERERNNPSRIEDFIVREAFDAENTDPASPKVAGGAV